MIECQAIAKFEGAGGRSVEAKVADVLTGLGFSRAVPRRDYAVDDVYLVYLVVMQTCVGALLGPNPPTVSPTTPHGPHA